MSRQLLSPRQVAKKLGVSVYTVRHLVKTKRLMGLSFGPAGRVRFVTRESLEKLLKE